MNRILELLFLGALVISCQPKLSPKILVFTKTEGFRHNSIEFGVEAIKKLGLKHGFDVDHSEDAELFNEKTLSQYNSIVFLSTTGDIFNEVQQYEFMRYCQAGGGFVGIHAATDTEYDWPWYGDLVGAYFNGHPPGLHEADINVIRKDHPICTHLQETWTRTDEWYNFKNINPENEVLLNLDESSYKGGTNGEVHPISWIQDRGENKMFYTAMGHTSESFSEEHFLKHILEGIKYTLGKGRKPDYSLANVGPNMGSNEVFISVGNAEPEINITKEGNSGFYFEDEPISYKVKQQDKENGALGQGIDPSEVAVNIDYLENGYDRNEIAIGTYEFH